MSARDQRIEIVLKRIWPVNISARGFAIHKMMKRPQNQDYIVANYPGLIDGYNRVKRYWFISLVPVVVLVGYQEIIQAHEMITDPEGFREKVSNQPINQWFRELFNNEN